MLVPNAFAGTIVGPVLLSILLLLLVTIIGMAIVIKRKQPACLDRRNVLKRYISLF